MAVTNTFLQSSLSRSAFTQSSDGVQDIYLVAFSLSAKGGSGSL